MKYLYSLFFLVFLASCSTTTPTDTHTGTNTQNTQTGSTVVSTENETAQSLVERLAVHLGKTASDVKKTTTIYQEYEDVEDIPAFVVKNTQASSDEAFNIPVYDMFDGWTFGTQADPILGYYSEYINDRFICALSASANQTDKIADFLNAETEEEQDAIYSQIDYILILECSEKPKDILSRLDINFEASGEHPYWTATIIHDELLLYNALNTEEDTHPIWMQSWEKQGEDYILEVDSAYGQAKAVLRKESCTDTAGEEKPFTAEITIADDVYQ